MVKVDRFMVSDPWHDRPLILKPNRVWRTYRGGLLLDSWQGADSPSDGEFPEEWAASLTVAVNRGRERPGEGLSRAASPDGRGERILKELISESPQAFLGKKHTARYGSDTGLLVKVLDAAERLTIQVHPDRAFARREFGSAYGKTEAWYVLDGRTIDGEPPYLLIGFKPGVTKATWADLFRRQDIEGMIDSLHRVPLQKGDVFLIEGGVPHAIGSGCLLVEIQEPTDYTLRPERRTPRGLDLPDAACHQGIGFEKMLECFHYDALSYEGMMERCRIQSETVNETREGRERCLVGAKHTDCFRMHHLEVGGRMRHSMRDEFAVALVVSGGGSLSWSKGVLPVRQGDMLFLPAGLEQVDYRSLGRESLQVVLCFPPSAG